MKTRHEQRDVRRAAVIGAGVMGAGIAQVLAVNGVEVTCVDRSRTQLVEARRLLEQGRYGLERAINIGKLSSDEAAEVIKRIAFTADLGEGVSGADVVIEAIPEDLDLKLELFEQLGPLVGAKTIIASNTSGLPVAALAAVSRCGDRVLGWHWASPAQVSKFAEIAVTSRTAAETTATVVALAVRCGKEPIVITENPKVWGFVANRIFFAAVREAQRVRDEGLATEEEIDLLMRRAYAWQAGPFAVVRGASEGWGDNRNGSVGALLGGQ